MALAVPLCSLPQGNQLVAELLGATFEFVFQSFALTLLFCGKKTFVISLSGGDQMENDARQFVGGRRDGRGGSMAGTHFSIVSAQVKRCSFPGSGRPSAERDSPGSHSGGCGPRESYLRSFCFGDRGRSRKQKLPHFETWTNRCPLQPGRCNR